MSEPRRRTGAPGPLDGIRVVDLTRMVSGPMATFYLASLGAEVIRVEMPGGDLGWRVPPSIGPRGEHSRARLDDEVTLGVLKRQRGKRSVVLDVKNPHGRSVLSRLAAASDVVVENLRPGVLDRLGVGADALCALNPRLVWCSITGFGQFGPDRDRPAMDVTMQAWSGVQARTGFPDGPPVRNALLAGDLGPAAFAAMAVAAALYDRARCGRGRRIDVAMHDVLTSWLWDEPLDVYEDAGAPERNGNAEPRGVPSDTYRCSDGWVALVTVDDEQWARLCRLLDRPDLARHVTNRDRVGAREEIDAAIGSWCRARRAGAVEQALVAADIPVAAVRSPWSARRDPHVAARRSIVALADHAGRPTGRMGPRLPVHLDGGEVELAPAELLGASTEAVLVEVLGLGEEDLGRLRRDGAFGPRT